MYYIPYNYYCTSRNVDPILGKHLHSSDKEPLLQFHGPNDVAADIHK
jgi:hypothetical protein